MLELKPLVQREGVGRQAREAQVQPEGESTRKRKGKEGEGGGGGRVRSKAQHGICMAGGGLLEKVGSFCSALAATHLSWIL